jgi:hypothetical protein
MRVMKPLLMMICLGVFVSLTPLAAKADDWNKATTLTFDKPVEIPGMVLGPGSYVFKLLDSPSERSVVQIFNADESRLYENVLTIPAYRLQPTDKTVITFEERANGAPEAIKDWYYPGDNYGQEFVYSKVKTAAVASLPAQKPTGTSGSAYASAPTRLKPAAPEHQVNTFTANPAAETAPVQIAQASTPPKPAVLSAASTKTLPKTASPAPVLILIGLLSLGASAAVQVFSKRPV